VVLVNANVKWQKKRVSVCLVIYLTASKTKDLRKVMLYVEVDVELMTDEWKRAWGGGVRQVMLRKSSVTRIRDAP
jgi:hypothetical protein